MHRFLLCAAVAFLLPLTPARATAEDPPDESSSTSSSESSGPTQEIVDSSRAVPWTRWGKDYEDAKQTSKEIDAEIKKAEEGN